MKISGAQVLSSRTRTHGGAVTASTPYIPTYFSDYLPISHPHVEIEEIEMGFLCGSFWLTISQLLATITDFPYPTIALITGHTFGGGCPLALAHNYRIMNSKRGFFCMP